MKFEKPSMDECQQIIERFKDKSADEIIGILGNPVRETGPRKDERIGDGVPFVVEIRRSLMFHDVSKTIHRFTVVERNDGKCEFHMQGRQIADE
jgi:hypothetical protein